MRRFQQTSVRCSSRCVQVAGRAMRALVSLAFAWMTMLSAPTPALAQAFQYPAGFELRDIATNGTTIHVRVGGQGPAVVLLHGYGETGDMWIDLAANLARDHKVVVPDLRGLGLSAKP